MWLQLDGSISVVLMYCRHYPSRFNITDVQYFERSSPREYALQINTACCWVGKKIVSSETSTATIHLVSARLTSSYPTHHIAAQLSSSSTFAPSALTEAIQSYMSPTPSFHRAAYHKPPIPDVKMAKISTSEYKHYSCRI
jgi:hypothetical protein